MYFAPQIRAPRLLRPVFLKNPQLEAAPPLVLRSSDATQDRPRKHGQDRRRVRRRLGIPKRPRKLFPQMGYSQRIIDISKCGFRREKQSLKLHLLLARKPYRLVSQGFCVRKKVASRPRYVRAIAMIFSTAADCPQTAYVLFDSLREPSSRLKAAHCRGASVTEPDLSGSSTLPARAGRVLAEA
jgi:hypothetical protein